MKSDAEKKVIIDNHVIERVFKEFEGLSINEIILSFGILFNHVLHMFDLNGQDKIVCSLALIDLIKSIAEVNGVPGELVKRMIEENIH